MLCPKEHIPESKRTDQAVRHVQVQPRAPKRAADQTGEPSARLQLQ